MNLFSTTFWEVFSSKLTASLLSELFVVFLVLALGYLLGRITVKGVSLGSSGVFIVALGVGIFLYFFYEKLGIKWIAVDKYGQYSAGSVSSVLKTLGLALFVTSVGFIAGPTFSKNFKKKALAYITIGVVIVLSGTAICLIIDALDPNVKDYTITGLLMGALTSTPGLSAAQGVFEGASGSIAAASGVAYPFGVLGVVLFVQIIPKMMRADMKIEVEKMKAVISSGVSQTETANESGVPKKKRLIVDSFGFAIFSLAVALGLIVGSLTFKMGPTAVFSLGTTGGALLIGLLFGHFKRIGRLSLEVPGTTLKTMRELGLVLFLTGSGVEGGLNFLSVVTPMLFVYGAIMTLLPMVIGFILAKYAFKLELLNNLGSICGGMTSTPALGSLIHVSGTDDVAQAYAATYPISLLLLVFVPQVVVWI